MALSEGMLNWNKRMKDRKKKSKKGQKISFEDQKETGGKMIYS